MDKSTKGRVVALKTEEMEKIMSDEASQRRWHITAKETSENRKY